jgi:hypothetical protein
MLKVFDKSDHTTLELRSGATGFCVEVNGHQVYWTADKLAAESLLRNLERAFTGSWPDFSLEQAFA